jgi:hypothetical protein
MMNSTAVLLLILCLAGVATFSALVQSRLSELSDGSKEEESLYQTVRLWVGDRGFVFLFIDIVIAGVMARLFYEGIVQLPKVRESLDDIKKSLVELRGTADNLVEVLKGLSGTAKSTVGENGVLQRMSKGMESLVGFAKSRFAQTVKDGMKASLEAVEGQARDSLQNALTTATGTNS